MAGEAPKQKPRDRNERALRRRRLRTGDIMLLLFLAVVVGAFLYLDQARVVGFLYSPWAVLIGLLLIGQYLLLKSGDRTRIYHMENARLRRRREADGKLLERARLLLKEGIDGPLTEEEGRAGDWRTRARDLMKDLDERF